MTDDSLEIRHDPAAHRFIASVDGLDGYVEYTESDGVLSIDHTVVPDAIGGRGIAAQLVQAAAMHARETGLRVAPKCSYAASWFGKHPEFADLQVGG